MEKGDRLYFFDNLRTFIIFLVVVFHAGVVYDKSAMGESWWVVTEPLSSDLPGVTNLMLDLFVMPTLFFVSGYLARASLRRRGARSFLAARARRLLLPWLLAVLTLIPAYKFLFLYSRSLPQEHWTSYFHFTNGVFGMAWLWFLPVLFLFDALYALASKLGVSIPRIGLAAAVAGVLGIGLANSLALGALNAYGWTKTVVMDFQNERLVPYLLVFLLGSLCHRLGIFESPARNMKLYIGVLATAWIPMNLYAVVLINFFIHPGEYFVSLWADRLLLWTGFHLSMLALLYAAVTTFHYYFETQTWFGRKLAELSYGVYIVHVIPLGLLALVLRGVEMPALAKYALLAVSAWAASNLLVWFYARGKATVMR